MVECISKTKPFIKIKQRKAVYRGVTAPSELIRLALSLLPQPSRRCLQLCSDSAAADVLSSARTQGSTTQKANSCPTCKHRSLSKC